MPLHRRTVECVGIDSDGSLVRELKRHKYKCRAPPIVHPLLFPFSYSAPLPPMNPRASLTLALSCIALAAFAQQRPPPVLTNDESGFQLIFDGKSLQGWQGDTNYWR